MRHEFEPEHFHVTIGSHEPVLSVADEDSIATWCVDAGGHDRSFERITEGGNPQTGPFYVEGAEPGDALEVQFDRLWPNRERGFTGPLVAEHVVDPWFVRELPYDRAPDLDFWVLDLERGTARLEDPPPGLESLPELPLEPMLGCFGVAPERGQGDGEVVGTGIEVSFDVEVTVRVVKRKEIYWPRAESEDFVIAVGNARPLDQALQHATTELMLLLEQDYGLSSRASSVLLGQCVRYDVGNVYDPAYTVAAKIEKRLLP